jgi:hypothetical protein
LVSNRFAAAIIIFNATMGFLSFLSSQYILTWLRGLSVGEAGIWIYADYPNNMGMLVSFYPIPNYPLIIFIFTLIVDCIFLIKLRNKN